MSYYHNIMSRLLLVWQRLKGGLIVIQKVGHKLLLNCISKLFRLKFFPSSLSPYLIFTGWTATLQRKFNLPLVPPITDISKWNRNVESDFHILATPEEFNIHFNHKLQHIFGNTYFSQCSDFDHLLASHISRVYTCYLHSCFVRSIAFSK